MQHDIFGLNPDLLTILRCPESHTALRIAEASTLREVSALISAGKVYSGRGALVKDPPHTLLCSGKGQLYSSRFGVPSLSSAERLVIEGTGLSAPSGNVAQGQSIDKLVSEFDFWVGQFLKEGGFSKGRYPWLFKDVFNFDDEFFAGKRVLDIGCGPCGSLEWIPQPGLLVGLDPLALGYTQFGTLKDRMKYVDAPAESMPFADGAFDIISSLNSLDHVDNVHSVLPEITRVLAPGGHFILFTELHEHPTINEPTTFGWEIREAFPSLRLVFLKEREKDKWNTPFDHSAADQRYGWLFAVYQKVEQGTQAPIKMLDSGQVGGEVRSSDLLRASPSYVKSFMLKLIQAQMGSVQDGKHTELSKSELQAQWSATLHEVLQREFPERYRDADRKESLGIFSIHYGFVVGQVIAEFWKGINALTTREPKALSDYTENFLLKVM